MNTENTNVVELTRDFFGVEWREGCEFGVTLQRHTAAGGWEKHIGKGFYENGEMLQRFYNQVLDWTGVEGNKATMFIYRWDNGPVLVNSSNFQ